jgi:TRAP transporter TAXI family solute receptor
MILSKDIDALTFEDIIKKKIKVRINIDNPNSATNILFQQMLQQYGLTRSDMEGWGCVFYEKADSQETKELFSSGIIDGYFYAFAAPHTIIVQNAQEREIRMIIFDPKIIDALCTSYGYEPAVIPAGTYPFLKKDYRTLTDFTILATTDKVSDETVYKMARSIHQNLVTQIGPCIA